MSFQIRPATRVDTPIIAGISGPTKSGKTYSGLELGTGLAEGRGPLAMLNAEGARGHQYADRFKYLACDIAPPYSYARYEEAVREIAKLKPGALVIDSMSHAHDGPGGMLEQHDKILDRMAGDKIGKARDAYTWAAWVKPKEEENKFIYTLLSMDFPIILCFRAKEKLKIVRGKEPIDLGWQPISSDRIAFETLFTLLLPPHSKGVPDISLSEMRDPFDKMIPSDEPITRQLGRELARWATGSAPKPSAPGESAAAARPAGESTAPPPSPPPEADYITPDQCANLETACQDAGVALDKLRKVARVDRLAQILAADYSAALTWIAKQQRT